ncbi:MAG TPA: aminotransferase class III-fold pyridoxal phosphate-dependent enzyme, partial [Parvularculaceae bacterium]|nr:aminotransferase class III-fold pyridoxal phosphate-dependent enzyme [Parvularculaceae bacterium]
TYSGHPVSCAVALKTLELYERWDIAAQVADVGPYFQKKLRAFKERPFVGDARGVGLVGALEFVSNKKTKEGFGAVGAGGAAIDRACREEGLIIRPLGDTIAFCPPLVITRDEIDELFARFSRALDKAEPQLSVN